MGVLESTACGYRGTNVVIIILYLSDYLYSASCFTIVFNLSILGREGLLSLLQIDPDKCDFFFPKNVSYSFIVS